MAKHSENFVDQLREASNLPEDMAEPVELQFATAFEAGVEDQEVPTTIQSALSFPYDATKQTFDRVVAKCTVRMMGNNTRQPSSINQQERQAIFNMLKAFNSIERFSKETAGAPIFRGTLSNILGETATAKRPFEYPEPLQRNAALIRDRLDNDLAEEETIDEQKSAQSETSSTDPNTKRKRGRPRKSASPTAPTPMPDNDPTYKHAMRGIRISGVGRRAYSLQQDSCPPPRNCNVVGHNGIEVGQWWPLRVCAIRDGAHGAMQGGIAGGASTGAYSVVVSTQYEALDVDRGNVIYYSGSNSHANQDPDRAVYTYATKALLLSKQQYRPVRVIRAASDHNDYAPSHGLRYDGLYDIAEEKIRHNPSGGAYVRFKLVRQTDQAAIDKNRPNEQERRLWKRVRDKSPGS